MHSSDRSILSGVQAFFLIYGMARNGLNRGISHELQCATFMSVNHLLLNDFSINIQDILFLKRIETLSNEKVAIQMKITNLDSCFGQYSSMDSAMCLNDKYVQ